MTVTFGETLLRLSPEGFRRFSQASCFDACYGGAESNTAVSLSQFGETVRHITRLPLSELGRACAGELARWGVDVSDVVWDGSPDARLGIYFCEQGASQRAPRVIYDRGHSSFSQAKRSNFAWERILEGADWFHFTGITPALGGELAGAALDACREARRRKIPVSCDLNYRSKLWEKAEAGKIMEGYMEYTDLLLANNGSLYDMFGIDEKSSATCNGVEATAAAARQAARRFGIPTVALTMRQSYSASQNGWSALLYQEGNVFPSRKYTVEIVDRIGGGDSFAAGMIYALKNGYTPSHAVEFAAAASCLKHTIPGDLNPISREEAECLAASGGRTLIER